MEKHNRFSISLAYSNAAINYLCRKRFYFRANGSCRKYSMEFYSVNSGDIVVSALLDILAVEMDDKAGYIAWWLYDDVDKTVSWEENGSEVSVDLTAVDVLYNFLVEEHNKRK